MSRVPARIPPRAGFLSVPQRSGMISSTVMPRLRAYLACTVRGDRAGVAPGRVICERLEANGHEVLTTHLLADDFEAGEAQATEAQIFQRDLAWLTACDVLVAEASGSSYGVGFEVGYILGRAASSRQQVVLL
jgi:hypothetical protein